MPLLLAPDAAEGDMLFSGNRDSAGKAGPGPHRVFIKKYKKNIKKD
jgi:hypothetical protein